MEGHEGDLALVLGGNLVGVRHQGDPLEKGRERTGLGDALVQIGIVQCGVGLVGHRSRGVPGVLVPETLLARRPLQRGLGGELPPHAHQLVEVVQARRVLRVVGGLQLGPVPGPVEHGLHQGADVGGRILAAGMVGAAHAPTELVEERDETRDRLDRAGGQQRDPALGRVPQGLTETDGPLLGMDRHARLRTVPDTPPRGVEDAAQRHRVVRVGEHLEVRDDVAHLLALVEPCAPDDLVGQTQADEHVLDHPGGVVGPVEHGHIGVPGVPGVHQAVDLPGDEPGLVVLVVRHVTHEELAGSLVGPEVLLPPARVAGDHGVGGGEDRLRRAVVLLEQDRPGVRIVVLEVLDVADRRAPERVDGLVRVAHHAELRRCHPGRGVVPGPGRTADERPDQDVLGVVGVLVLVHHDVPEPAPVVRRNLRVRPQQPDGLPDQVVEVEGVGRLQPRLVLGEHRRHRLRGPVRVLQRTVHGLRRLAELVLVVRDGRGEHPRRELLDLEVLLLGDHAEQATGIVRVVDREIGVARAQQRGLGPQDPHTDRVERGHPHPFGMGPHQGGHPLPHLGGGLVGERDGEDLPGVCAPLGQQVRDPPGQHAGLPGTRAGHDQQRTAAVRDRGGLLWVESVQER